MPFDVFTLAAVHDELTGTILGGRVDKIIQPSRYGLAFKIWANGHSRWLLVSADPRYARMHLSGERLAKAFDTPGSFVMLLRKYCDGGRIAGVCQSHLERVLTLEIASHAHGSVSLVTEIMGNRSNVILVAATGEILGALKLIGASQSRVRRILPHEQYVPPPSPVRPSTWPEPGPRLDPLSPSVLEDSAIERALPGLPPGISMREGLVGLLQGCSPSIAADIAARCGVNAQTLLHNVSAAGVVAAIREQYGLLVTREWRPIVVVDAGTPVDYRAYDAPGVPGSAQSASMSLAIDRVTAGQESTDALKSARAQLRKSISGRRAEAERRLASLHDGLHHAEEAGILRESGELILAYQYGLSPGAAHLAIPELDRDIALDPTHTPMENAERYFKRYRKARDASRQLPPLIERAEVDLAFVDELDAYVDLAETERDLVRIGDELAARFGGPARARKKAPAPGEPLRLRLDDAEVLIGRNARQNDRVTFDLAGRGDLWLHTRGVPGAHVVVRGGNKSEGVICRAAQLAAYFSRARGGAAVDVDVTEVRNVRRRPGGSPGQVTYRHERTVRVAPASPSM